jgi:DNA topoisomerase IA
MLLSLLLVQLAEELYQWGFISYPRTETDRFQDGIDLQVQPSPASKRKQYS